MKPIDVSFGHATRVRLAFSFVFGVAAAIARGDVIVVWNEALTAYVSASDAGLAPHLEARAYAVAHLAAADAIAEVGRELHGSRAREAGERAAIASAARESIAALVPHAREQAEALAAEQLASIPDCAEKTRGIASGRAAAVRLLQRRENDNWLALARFRPPAGPLPDVSEHVAKAIVAGRDPPVSPWRAAKPFFLRSVEQIDVAVPYSMAVDGKLRKNFTLLESKLFAEVDRTQPEGVLARTWAGNAVAAWNRIAGIMARDRALPLADEARMFAVLNAALADATLSALHWRFALGSWRAMMVETWEDTRGQPMLSTDFSAPAVIDGLHGGMVHVAPRRVLIAPMPNYPSVPATIAGAAQAALAESLKGDNAGFTLEVSGSEGAPMSRGFGSLGEAARESAFVATFDGRHTREAGIAGYQLGAAIGRHVARRFPASRR